MNFRLILISLLFCFSSMFAQANDEFVEAVKDSNLEKVKILLKTKVNLNASDSREMTPLLLASGDNNLEMVKLLVEAGADVNRKHKETGKTPLIYAAANGHLDILKYLLDRPGILVNAKDKEGKTALIHAVFYARKDAISILLDNKANPNARTNVDESALSFALKGGRPEIVSLLKQAGARE
ncbi:MAG: ankyrin repeat domain-containing protein [Leptospiraceae bacterium]|nr:ankyrin repeat domain-containing protein [Leptospiraceae bacterium]